MMQESLGGESSASAKRALAKVQKMLQIVSTKRTALALKDYREALEVRKRPQDCCVVCCCVLSLSAFCDSVGVFEDRSEHHHESIGVSTR